MVCVRECVRALCVVYIKACVTVNKTMGLKHTVYSGLKVSTTTGLQHPQSSSAWTTTLTMAPLYLDLCEFFSFGLHYPQSSSFGDPFSLDYYNTHSAPLLQWMVQTDFWLLSDNKEVKLRIHF